MTKQEFIDKLFEDQEDALLESDVDSILDYFDKHYNEISNDDFQAVFLKVLSSLMDKGDVEKYKQSLGLYLYMKLAAHMGIEDIVIDNDFKTKFRFSSNYWSNVKPLHFKTVTVGPDVDSVSYIECDELIINGNNEKGRILNLSVKAKTITFNTYVESVSIDWCKNLFFDENAVIYETTTKPDGSTVKVPVLMKDFNTRNPQDVEKVILPPVDGVQISRWMCTKLNKEKTIIYKQVGQKISIFSVYKDWLKEHVKSV